MKNPLNDKSNKITSATKLSKANVPDAIAARKKKMPANKSPAKLKKPSPVQSHLAVDTQVTKYPPRGKLGRIISLLERADGTTLTELMTETGWQAHSVRGALSTLKKRLDRPLNSSIDKAGTRSYRLGRSA